MKIGIFGGSFNPPHKMHEYIAEELLRKKYIDQLIFVPTGIKYEYKNNLQSNEHRLNMLKLITDKKKSLSVSDFEFKNEPIYTCDTLNYFKKKYKDADIYFICGADNLSYIDKWKNGEDLLRNTNIIAIVRNTDNIKEIISKYQKYSPNIEVAEIPPFDLSSTKIRNLIKNSDYQELKKYLDSAVLNYILEENLYN